MIPLIRITANQDFLHGEDRYVKGEDYDVEPELAGYFVGVGWADTDEDVKPTATPPPAEVDLDVQSSAQGQAATDG